MRYSCIKAIMKKDTIMAMRNSLVLMGLIAGILFALIYYVLPANVEETFYLAVYDEGDSQYAPMLKLLDLQGLDVDFYDSLAAFENGFQDDNYTAGIVIPGDFDSMLASGGSPTLTMYFRSDTPENIQSSIMLLVQQTVDLLTYGEYPYEFEIEILGDDLAGAQVPLRRQSIPLYLLLALTMEMWTIATLIVEESAAGTMKAVLVTPATPTDVISAKTIIGLAYTLFVVSVILLLTQSVRGDFIVLFLCMLLGAILAVSLGLFLGSLSENITGSYIYAALPMLVLMLPALLIFFPGVSLSVVKYIPSYYLANSFSQTINLGAGIMDLWKDLLIIAAFDVAFFFLGIFALRRRYS